MKVKQENNCIDKLKEIYLQLENAYVNDSSSYYIVSGLSRAGWVRFCYIRNSKTLVVTNTQTGEQLFYNY